MKTIAIIEDQYFILQSLKKFISEKGYNVITAKNGYEGLRLITNNPPDLIIVDLNMPVMDGFTTIEEIKKNKSLANIPIIILTGFGEMDFIKKALKLGVTNYIVKPYIQEELLRRIKLALGELKEEIKPEKIEKKEKKEKVVKSVIGDYVLFKDIPIEEAKEGMVIATNLTSNSQLVLLPEGTVLTKKLIEKLKGLNVKTVPIKISEGEKNE